MTSERRVYVWATHFALCEDVLAWQLRQRIADEIGVVSSRPSQFVSEGTRRRADCPVCGKTQVRRRQRSPLSVYHQFHID